MYACVCNALTEKEVRGAIDRGARSVGQVFALAGRRAQCGTCSSHMRGMLRDHERAAEACPEASPALPELGVAATLGLAAEPA